MPFHLRSLCGASRPTWKSYRPTVIPWMMAGTETECWIYGGWVMTKVHEIAWPCREPFVVSYGICRLSIALSVTMFAVKLSKKWAKIDSFSGLNFFRKGRPPKFSDLLATIWQGLVEFRLLTSVCEAWQWSRMEKLRRVGQNSGPIFRCL